jgi:replicative DNA helicase
VADPAKARRERGSIAAVDSPTPPHSIEAEQAVLGGLLLDPSAWDQVADVINEKDFYRPDHRLIFEAIGALAGAAKPCDAVTVSEQLERTSNLEAAGGMAYLSSLARDTPTAANVRAYADIVRERSLLRQLIHAGTEIAAAVYNNEGETARDLVDRAEQRVFEIAEQGFRGRQGAIAVRSLLPQVIDQIDEWHTNPDKLRGLPTGFTDFDKLTGGLRPGDLVIVAGRPSMGKTTLAVNMAEYAAVHQGTKASVAIFSMEMPSEQVITRMLSSIGGVPLGNLRSGRISDDDWVRITSATSQLSEAKIFVDETPALTPTELRARARRIKREHGLNLVVVDYLQLMQVPGTKENRATEIAEISRGLKVLAKELAVPVIALSQLNRAVEQRDHKKPIMSDLRECVTGDTLVWLTDGRQVPISNLVGTRPEVWAVDEQQRVVAARSDMVWKVGRRPVASVKLATGRSIRVTAEHRVLSGEGWVRAAKLRTGDHVALARRVPEPARPNRWPDHWLILLGHLAGDGRDLTHQPLRYRTASGHNSEAVRAAAETFGSTVKRHPGRGRWHELLIGGDGNRRHSAGVGKWLQELGIWGQRSHEKRLPQQVFTLAKEQIALLLRHLWAADGRVLVPPPGLRRAARVTFSTCSAGLAEDVAALLLRLGIVARLRVSLGAPDTRPLHTVDVGGAEFLRRFVQTVGFGPRAIPLCVLAERGASHGGTGHFRPAPGRAPTGESAKSLTAPDLEPLATSDLFWDRVVDVVPQIDEEDVYDLTVPGPSSWLSDGIVSHNSGAIEQDADMILLIYREEVYDKNTTKKGIAEIDLVKHRNGEIGTFRLTFQGQYTRFANYAPDAYAEGVLR